MTQSITLYFILVFSIFSLHSPYRNEGQKFPSKVTYKFAVDKAIQALSFLCIL